MTTTPTDIDAVSAAFLRLNAGCIIWAAFVEIVSDYYFLAGGNLVGHFRLSRDDARPFVARASTIAQHYRDFMVEFKDGEIAPIKIDDTEPGVYFELRRAGERSIVLVDLDRLNLAL